MRPTIKMFLIQLALRGCEVEIFDSFSELIFSKDFRWIRETENDGYYDELLGKLKTGMKVALVRKDLIKDLDMNNLEDKLQIAEEKGVWYPEGQNG